MTKVADCRLPLHLPLNQKEATDTGAQAVERYPYNREKNVLIRRSTPDRSQRIRRIVQLLFVALNGLLGVQFLLWVRYFESGGNSMYVPRPAGVEGWLPIAGLMNLKYFLLTGHVPSIDVYKRQPSIALRVARRLPESLPAHNAVQDA